MLKTRVVFAVSLVLFAMMAAVGIAQSEDDVTQAPECKYCGMNRGTFAHTRMLVIYDDGVEVATCSLHCTAVDSAFNIDKTPKSIRVGDYDSKNLIDAESAVWVLGGRKPGVMTQRAKWAFEKKEGAEKFIASNGGTLTNFEEIMKASYDDIYADTKMIREKRKMKTMQNTERKQ